MNPRAVRFMAERGYDLSAHASKSLEAFDGAEFDVAVTMGCGDECPYVPGKKYVDWQLEDPAGKGVDEVRRIRDEIARRVTEL